MQYNVAHLHRSNVVFLSLFRKYFYYIIFALLCSIFLLHYVITGQAVYGDGVGYYAHLHSWVIDDDWNYTNEYQHRYSPENNNALTPENTETVQIVGVTKSGRASNHFFPGTAVLLLPFYITAHFITQFLIFWGNNLAHTGYSDVYQISVGIGSIVYVTFGLYFLEKLLVIFFPASTQLKLVILILLCATPLIYYGSYDVINSHGVSFFLSSLFFYLLFLDVKKYWITMTVVAGLAMLVRFQEILLSVIYFLSLFEKLLQKKISFEKLFSITLPYLLILAFVLVPLYIYWFETFASITEHTYIQAFINERQSVSEIDFLGPAFNSQNGLFIKSPLLLILFSYFIWLLLKRKKRRYWQLAVFFFFQYLVITFQGGWSAAAFGGRMFISSLPFFAVLLADLLNHVYEGVKKHFYVLVSVLLIFQLVTILQFVFFTKEAERDTFGVEQRTKVRIKQLLQKNVW